MSNRRLQQAVRVIAPAVVGAALALPLASTFLSAQTPPAVQPLVPAQTAPAAPATQPRPDSVVIKLGNETVTLEEFELFISNLNPSDQEMARGPYRRAWADSLANMKLLAKEARNKQLDQKPEVQKQLAVMRDQVLANAMVLNVQETMDDAYLRKHFDEHRQQLERVSARHILIRIPGSAVPLRPGQKELTAAESKAKIDALAARIKAGEDFAKIAEAESDDTGSAVDGGDLGSFTRGKMVAAFEQTAFSLKENEVSAPVQSPFGWHLIQVTGRFDTFEKLAGVLRQQLGPQRTNQLVRDLREQTKVELNDAIVGPPAPVAPVQGQPVQGQPVP
ncbi:peptidylprolyl isomerase [Humisphaera borealis]|uniref:Peptidylprolyl isomerase n=1 Tax=Humisphaera borealis TaxID=2807512 RepID=A0A7M2WQ62_9BACT|nr:peptidylprolyl isomerase [Humisphaera borealis]QOV87665.1 peptidylprolyl isomerase [Humisphaera borealis]